MALEGIIESVLSSSMVQSWLENEREWEGLDVNDLARRAENGNSEDVKDASLAYLQLVVDQRADDCYPQAKEQAIAATTGFYEDHEPRNLEFNEDIDGETRGFWLNEYHEKRSQTKENKLDDWVERFEEESDNDYDVFLGIATGAFEPTIRLAGEEANFLHYSHVSGSSPEMGEVRSLDDVSLGNKDVLVIDDMRDTGETMYKVLESLTSEPEVLDYVTVLGAQYNASVDSTFNQRLQWHGEPVLEHEGEDFG